MEIQAVVFDFGGVLLRTVDQTPRRRWEERCGLEAGELVRLVFDSEVARRATVGEATDEDVWRYVGEVLGIDGEDLDRLREDFFAGDRFERQLVAFLGELRPRYRTGILSNAWPSAREVFTSLFGLDRVTDVMVISAEVGLAKPDPRIYHLTAERLGVPPETVIFVDDMPENVEAAREVGMYGIVFHDPEETVAQIRAVLGEG